MKHLVFLTLVCLLSWASMGAKNIRLAGGQSYFVTVNNGQKNPTLILLPEWWGVTPYVKSQADSYSKRFNINVLVVDFFKGKTASEAPEAQKLADQILTETVLSTLQKAMAALKKLPEVDSKKIGILGFGLGGKIALRAAPVLPELKMVGAICGQPLLEPEKLQLIKSPLLAVFGDEDKAISMKSVEQFQKALAEAHLDRKVVVIKGVGQGFFNSSTYSYYNGKAALELEAVINEFLNQRLLQKF